MAAPTFKAIADSALQAILDLTQDGKQQASFQGREYTALTIDELWGQWRRARDLAVANGEIPLTPGIDKISVSTPVIIDPFLLQ